MLGLLPVTLRAWERRYGLPSPHRGEQGYRLYSDHDVQTLRWLKMQIDLGMNIGQAARKLNQLREIGMDPAAREFSSVGKPLSLENIREDVLQSLLELNNQSAAEYMRQAYALYPTDQVFCQVMEPILQKIKAGHLLQSQPPALTHFIYHFFLENMLTLQAVAPQPYRNGVIVAGSLHGQVQEIRILMVVVLLRMRGWNVVYLGSDLQLENLEAVLLPLHARVAIFSDIQPQASSTARELRNLTERLPALYPFLLMDEDPPQTDKPYQWLRGCPAESVRQIEMIMNTGRATG